jgi:zinc transporter ZupT
MFAPIAAGLATFVAALEDPKVGAVLAIAIAIHNVPEGEYQLTDVASVDYTPMQC